MKNRYDVITSSDYYEIWQANAKRHADDCHISSKFGTQIDFHVFKRVHSLNLNPEMDLRLHGSCLKNRYDKTQDA